MRVQHHKTCKDAIQTVFLYTMWTRQELLPVHLPGASRDVLDGPCGCLESVRTPTVEVKGRQVGEHHLRLPEQRRALDLSASLGEHRGICDTEEEGGQFFLHM